MLKIFVQAVVIIVLSYALIAAMVYFLQDGMLYFPDRTIAYTPRDINLAYQDVSFLTRDGVKIAAWYIEARPERGVVLFCHGNAGNISHRLDSLRVFNRLNLSVLIFDYRGYGLSEGRPTEPGTYLDAEAAWEHLVGHRQKPSGSIILFGRSLGGAVAARTACGKNPAALIIESSFTSVPDFGKKLYPWLPVRLLSKFSYNTIDIISTITCPKLIVHSPEDEIVPYRFGMQLYEAAAPPKELLNIRGGHNDGFILSGTDYIEGLRVFLDKHLT